MDRIQELSEIAKARRMASDVAVMGAMGGADIDYMTPEERAEFGALIQALPTFMQQRDEARNRIMERISKMRGKV